MRDIRPAYSIGIPLGSMLLFLAVAIASPAAYAAYVRKHEVGVQDFATPILLVPAIIFSLVSLRRRQQLPAKWLTVWLGLVTLGAVFFCGEECSWGQNYLHWVTPEGWSEINKQHETNLHNTSNLFNHVPRALLSMAAWCCVVAPCVLYRQRQQWKPGTSPWAWFWPTAAVVPTALVASLVDIPQKFHGQYLKDVTEATWYGELFLDGRHSEMKEYFLAMFMLMYLWSFATRLGSLNEMDLAAGNSDSGAADSSKLPSSGDRHAAAA